MKKFDKRVWYFDRFDTNYLYLRRASTGVETRVPLSWYMREALQYADERGTNTALRRIKDALGI